MVGRKPTKYRARTAPIAAQPDMFGGPPKVQMRDPYPCEFFGCRRHGTFGFGLSGTRMGAGLTKYFCDQHRAHGEEHYGTINGRTKHAVD